MARLCLHQCCGVLAFTPEFYSLRTKPELDLDSLTCGVRLCVDSLLTDGTYRIELTSSAPNERKAGIGGTQSHARSAQFTIFRDTEEVGAW